METADRMLKALDLEDHEALIVIHDDTGPEHKGDHAYPTFSSTCQSIPLSRAPQAFHCGFVCLL